MSAARDLFLQRNSYVAPGDMDAYARLCQAAELWRIDGEYFSAGMARLRASDAAWGHPDQMLKAHRAAVMDFEQVMLGNSPDSPASLAALYKLVQTLVRASRLFDIDTTAVGTRVRELNSELAQRLVTYFRESEHADNYLIRGFIIATRLDGDWALRFPSYEVPLGTELFGEEFVLHIPSAFHLFTADRDWRGAYQVVEARGSAFVSPGLRGWRAVTLAHVNPGEAVTWFDEAADAFAADAQPLWEELTAPECFRFLVRNQSAVIRKILSGEGADS